MNEVFPVAVSLFPVLLFVAALKFLDSYKLVRLRFVFAGVAVGFFSAWVALLANTAAMALTGLAAAAYSRLLAPLVEEAAKAVYIVVLIRTGSVGFIVDAAIKGAAVGAGFACAENVYYLLSVPHGEMALWAVRGLGTAVMHAGCAAVFAVLAKSSYDREGAMKPAAVLPGLALSVAAHVLFNDILSLAQPVFSMLVVLAVFPALMVAVFERSEGHLKSWLGVDFDSDVALLGVIRSGKMTETRPGLYLRSLLSRFPGEVVADMLCYVRVLLELSIKAKGVLLMRESGVEIPRDESVGELFREMAYLEKSVGKTGLLAVAPVCRAHRREIWQLRVL